MVKITLLAIGLAGALLATGVAAQTPVAQPATPAPAAADPTADQIASWIAGNHGEVQGVDAQDGPPLRDGKIHGEVGASIGSGGYRSAYGIATMPLGQKGDLTVGVSDEHLGGGNRGYVGRGYGGNRQGLYIGLDLTGDHGRCNSAVPNDRNITGRAPLDRSLGDPTWGTPGYGGDPACSPNASQPAR